MKKNEREIEAGRLLFARECKFMLSVPDVMSLPPPDLPEVAFAGRSNVGKSSLINALTGRRNLAVTANYPGRTQMLNYFDMDGRLMLVDMPGYGYAKAPKSVVKNWTRLIYDYLKGRANLRRVFILVDARHGFKDNDEEIMAALDKAAVAFQIVLTKVDKLKEVELAKIIAKVKAVAGGYTAGHPEILTTSSVTEAGIPELRAEIAEFAV